jgi:mono/diheme cytochrome c family protein
MRERHRMKKPMTLALLCLLSMVVLLPSSAKKTNVHHKIDGEQVFQQHCAGCHAGGGNTVKPNRPLAGSKELNSLATFKAYLSIPPGHMPYFKDVVGDRRTLTALWKYCKTLKADRQQAGAGVIN